VTPLVAGGGGTGGSVIVQPTQWLTASNPSNIYFPNSVGIGPVNPQYNLDVSNGTTASKYMLVSNIASLGGPSLNITSNVIISANLAVGGQVATTPPYALYVSGQGYFSQHISYENFAGFRNRLVNGSFRVAYRANTLTISNTASFSFSNTWVCDRWRADLGNLSQSNIAMTVSQTTPVGTTNGFTNTANVYVSRALVGTTGNTWICPLTQTIEAGFVFDMRYGQATAKPAVFSFWANTTVTGDYSVIVRSRTDNTYFANLVHIVAGTWVNPVVYIPSCYIGSWEQNPTAGYMDILFGGVSYGTTTSNHMPVATTTTWMANPGFAPVACIGATEWPKTAGAFIQFTGPQFEHGTIATPFEVRPLNMTVTYCQRFYETNPDIQYAAALNSGRINSVPFVVTKRANPNVSVYTTLSNLSANTNISRFTSITSGGTYANTAVTNYTSSEYGYTFTFTQGSGNNKIDEAQFVWQADAEIY
jgi:hypothetical protein